MSKKLSGLTHFSEPNSLRREGDELTPLKILIIEVIIVSISPIRTIQ